MRMRICSTYGSAIPMREGSDMNEVRLDVFQSLPEGIDENTIITLAGRGPSMIPAGFKGLVDAGCSDIELEQRIVRSYHDFEGTPSSDEILSILHDSGQEISKGAFTATSFRDLHSLFIAANSIGRKHVIIGMGDAGTVTRVRQRLMGNEFTFGYVDAPTAPGQLSFDELESLGDDCIIAGITGDPVKHSKSPLMQNAAMKASGMNGIYLRFGSPDLEMMREVMEEYDIRGMNITIPHKQDAMDQMDDVSRTAEAVGAVNTVTNSDGWFHGDNTDVDGVMRTFEDEDVSGRRVLIMGSGGAARAASYSFMEMGCDTHVIGRNPGTVNGICRDLGTEQAFSRRCDDYDIIVNCTPIGMYASGNYPADVTRITEDQTVFDMVYGIETPLIAFARGAGCDVRDGTDMLVGQGAASFRRWFGMEPDTRVMREALR